MKRRTFLQLFGGTAVSVPVAKNLTFDIPEEEDPLDYYEDDFDAADATWAPSPGPHVGDVILFDGVMAVDYDPDDVFDCFPCESLNYNPVPETPGRDWSREIGTWGEMMHRTGMVTEIHPVVQPEWRQDEDGYFHVEWMLVRNKTLGIKFARVYLDHHGSNELGDLTITWSVNGLIAVT